MYNFWSTMIQTMNTIPSDSYHLSINNLSINCLSSIFHQSMIYLSSVVHVSIINLPIYHLSIFCLSSFYLSFYLSIFHLSSIYKFICHLSFIYLSIFYLSSIYKFIYLLSSFYHTHTHTWRINTNIKQIAPPSLLNRVSYRIQSIIFIYQLFNHFHLSTIMLKIKNVQLVNTFGVISKRSSE